MKCPCKGTWKEPCMECYTKALQARATQSEAAPTPEDMDTQLLKAGVPGHAVAALKAGIKTSPELQAAQKFHENARNLTCFLALFGPPGRGKTLAAAWVMREHLKQHKWNNTCTGQAVAPVQFLRAAVLTRVSSFDALDSHWLAELKKVPLLVLDDLGDEATKSGVDVVSDILSERYDKRRGTVLTSNLLLKAFAVRYGAAVASRLDERGLVVESPGKSMRRTHAAA